MKTTTNIPFTVAFAVVSIALLLFGGGAITAGITNSGAHESGYTSIHSWMWTAAFFTLGLGVVLGWFVFKKKA